MTHKTKILLVLVLVSLGLTEHCVHSNIQSSMLEILTAILMQLIIFLECDILLEITDCVQEINFIMYCTRRRLNPNISLNS